MAGPMGKSFNHCPRPSNSDARPMIEACCSIFEGIPEIVSSAELCNETCNENSNGKHGLNVNTDCA